MTTKREVQDHMLGMRVLAGTATDEERRLWHIEAAARALLERAHASESDAHYVLIHRQWFGALREALEAK